MAVNKVEYFGRVILDLTEDTITDDKLHKGVTAHDKSGAKVTGTFTLDNEITTQDELITAIKTALQGKASGGGTPTPTQEKTVDITENGTFEVIPDDGYALSKVTANVNVASSGGGDEIPWLTREITEYSNPTLTKLGAYALSGTNIVTLNLPMLTTIAGYAFYQCTKLTEVNFPLLTEVPNNGFREFSGVVKADFASITIARSNCFYKCTSLETLILRTQSVITLASGTTFTATPIANGTGYIYVPSALVDSYKAATNWSAFADQFRAIEDYPDICGGA